MRTFRIERSYDEAPEALLLLWRDPDFLAALGERYGGVGKPEIEEQGDRVLVRTRRELPLDKLPGFVRRFVASGLLEQTDDWPRTAPADAAQPIEGSWQVTGSMPATMSGGHAVRPSAAGCVVEVSGTVKVSAPLIAGKAEDLVVGQISTLINRQQEFAANWLKDRRRDSTS